MATVIVNNVAPTVDCRAPRPVRSPRKATLHLSSLTVSGPRTDTRLGKVTSGGDKPPASPRRQPAPLRDVRNAKGSTSPATRRLKDPTKRLGTDKWPRSPTRDTGSADHNATVHRQQRPADRGAVTTARSTNAWRPLHRPVRPVRPTRAPDSTTRSAATNGDLSASTYPTAGHDRADAARRTTTAP